MNTNIATTGATAVIDPQSLDLQIPVLTDDQKRLRALVSRRHPEYECNVQHWKFLDETYEGGREWFKNGNIFRYVKEGNEEYKDRVERCYRFNHSREVVDLLNKYLFKQHITRNEVDAPESVKTFWEKSTKNGLKIRDFSRQAGKKSSIFGRVGVVVDNNGAAAGAASRAEEKAAGVRTYAYIVSPTQLLDYSHDDSGELNWILIQEISRDDADPMSSSGAETPRWRLWDKEVWRLFEEQRIGKSNKTRIVEIGNGIHGLGEVPVVLHDNIITDEDYVAPALIDEIAYLDRAVANYLSNLDAVIQDQTYSQLAMPAQNVLPGSDTAKTLQEMGTKRVFLYDGEGGTKPEYLSPDPKQAQMILTAIKQIINEIYHTVGLAGERTKQDNSVGIDNSSGVAKAYDFERVNALLQAKADSLEVLENRIARLVAKWHGEEAKIDNDLVTYPDDFDTRGLYDEFDIAARLMLIEAPPGLRREQMLIVIDKLFPQIGAERRAELVAELKDWPVDPVELAGDMAAATAAAQPPTNQGSVSSAKAKKPGA